MDKEIVTAELRIGDRERDQAIVFLHQQCTDGVLTLDEFSDRTGRALAATTSTELAVVVADLPGAGVATPVPSPEVAGLRRRRLKIRLSVFGASRQEGRWRPADHNLAVAIFGSLSLDLRDAALDRNVTVHAISVFGSIKVTAPEGVEIDNSAIGIFGSAGGSAVPSDEDVSPIVVHIDGAAVFGSISARTRPARGRKGTARMLRR